MKAYTFTDLGMTPGLLVIDRRDKRGVLTGHSGAVGWKDAIDLDLGLVERIDLLNFEESRRACLLPEFQIGAEVKPSDDVIILADFSETSSLDGQPVFQVPDEAIELSSGWGALLVQMKLGTMLRVNGVLLMDEIRDITITATRDLPGLSIHPDTFLATV